MTTPSRVTSVASPPRTTTASWERSADAPSSRRTSCTCGGTGTGPPRARPAELARCACLILAATATGAGSVITESEANFTQLCGAGCGWTGGKRARDANDAGRAPRWACRICRTSFESTFSRECRGSRWSRRARRGCDADGTAKTPEPRSSTRRGPLKRQSATRRRRVGASESLRAFPSLRATTPRRHSRGRRRG